MAPRLAILAFFGRTSLPGDLNKGKSDRCDRLAKAPSPEP